MTEHRFMGLYIFRCIETVIKLADSPEALEEWFRSRDTICDEDMCIIIDLKTCSVFSEGISDYLPKD